MANELEYQAEMFANRLKKRFKHLRKWATRNDVTCYRLYERDIPEVPLVVDLYEHYLHMAEFHSPHKELPGPPERYREVMSDTARRALGIEPSRVFYKTRRITGREEQYDRLDTAAVTAVVSEGGLRFKVNLSDYLDTGLFLDHRPTRALVRDTVEVMKREHRVRVLNLFSYTGSFSVYASAGGADETVSVDLSRPYTIWAEENLKLNALDPRANRCVNADVFEFLKGEHAKRARYDVVVLDPPTFSNSKKMQRTLDVQRDQRELLADCANLLSPGGVLVFSTNRHGFKLTDPPAGFDVEDVTEATIPPDYRDRKVHQCWLVRRPTRSGS